MPYILADDQRAKSLVIDRERFVIALDELVRQVEHSYLLDHILVYHKVGVIVHLSALLGATAYVSEGLAAVAEVDYRSRDSDSRHYERHPPDVLSTREDNYIAHELYDVTEDVQRLVKYLNRSVPCLTVSVLKLFVKLGAVKGGKVKILCLVHYLKLDVPYYLLARYSRNEGVKTRGKVLKYPENEHEYYEHHYGRREEFYLFVKRDHLLKLVEYVLGYYRTDYGYDSAEQ